MYHLTFSLTMLDAQTRGNHGLEIPAIGAIMDLRSPP